MLYHGPFFSENLYITKCPFYSRLLANASCDPSELLHHCFEMVSIIEEAHKTGITHESMQMDAKVYRPLSNANIYINGWINKKLRS